MDDNETVEWFFFKQYTDDTKIRRLNCFLLKMVEINFSSLGIEAGQKMKALFYIKSTAVLYLMASTWTKLQSCWYCGTWKAKNNFLQYETLTLRNNY